MIERNADVPEDRRIEIRIGINLGDVVVDGDDIHGDGVNIAAHLEGEAKPGGICISDDVMRQVRGRLDLALTDGGKQEFKNIAQAVRTWHWAADTATKDAAQVELSLPDKPSIAVLPFDNISGDPEQEAFADGLTEDIITELSRYRGFHVIARNATFIYKGSPTDPTKIAQELGARYVLEGSVRRAGQRLRITAQLIDGTIGTHLWAERYDRDLKDTFEVQDEVTRIIASTLGELIFEDGMARAIGGDPNHANAYDLVSRGFAHYRRFTRSDNEEARKLGEKAKNLAPRFAGAYRLLAWVYLNRGGYQWVEDIEGAFRQSHELARETVVLDDKAPASHLMLGMAELHVRLHDRAIDSLQRAIKLNPNSADGYAILCHILTHAERAEEGLANMKIAMEINPQLPASYSGQLGRMQFVLGNYVEAERAFLEALNSGPDNPINRGGLAASLVALGRLDEARVEVKELLGLNPVYSLRNLSRTLPFKNQKDLGRLLDFLHQAGLPE